MLPPFARLSLSRQFLVASFPILVIGMLGIGLWVGKTIERGVLNRTGGVTSLYVDSFIAPHLQHLVYSATLEDVHRAALDRLLTQTPLGQKIVAFKIWNREGRVLYSTNTALIGRIFPISEGLAGARSPETCTPRSATLLREKTSTKAAGGRSSSRPIARSTLTRGAR